jgi:predicted transglutaminase-like cysteine proteinase
MFRITRKTIITGLAFAVAIVGTPALAGPGALVRPLKNATNASFMPQGKQTIAPFAHVRFCIASPGECSDGSGPSIVELTPAKRNMLRSVNSRVNSAIEPYMPDGPETWVIGPDRGNCHDYAVTKRHELIRMGWPAASLRLAVAYTRSGIGHLVVVVRTSEGDLVLDNLTENIVAWNKSGLRFVAVDAGDKPRVWYAMR